LYLPSHAVTQESECTRSLKGDLPSFLGQQPETGMGYWVITAVLKDGRRYDQVLVNSGYVTQAKNHRDLSFTEHDIDHSIVTHEKWDFNGT
jgi:cytochrome oxidase assembly protein ShyY1